MIITSRQVGKVTLYAAVPTNESDWLTKFDVTTDSILAYQSSKKYQSKNLIALEAFYDITDEQNNEFLAQKAELEASLAEETSLEGELMP